MEHIWKLLHGIVKKILIFKIKYYFQKAGSSSVVYSVVVDSSNKTSCVIEDLPGYANYTVEVEAINSAGASPTSQPEYVFMSIRGKLKNIMFVNQWQ